MKGGLMFSQWLPRSNSEVWRLTDIEKKSKYHRHWAKRSGPGKSWGGPPPPLTYGKNKSLGRGKGADENNGRLEFSDPVSVCLEGKAAAP